METFEDLAIFLKARELSKQVYQITRQGEFKYDSRFVQQIRASAGSVMDNIAEGYESQGNKEFKNFLYIAKGSCGELRSQVMRAHDVNFITDETYNQMYADCKKLSIAIANFIKTIKDSEFKGTRYQ